MEWIRNIWVALELSRIRLAWRLVWGLGVTLRGFAFSLRFQQAAVPLDAATPAAPPAPANPAKAFFDARREGRGIWKWEHYFNIYQRHFAKFVGREVHVLEIGVYSGGSLDLWVHYFGIHARIYGVDIEPACQTYASERVQVFIGDQADRCFWRKFREQVPTLDVVIDDGGHRPGQQIVTLEEMLPHLRPGGVYLCEDIHGAGNPFTGYVRGMVDNLNALTRRPGASLACPATAFQAQIESVHCYPYVTVIEKALRAVDQLRCPKHGTQWQPFL